MIYYNTVYCKNSLSSELACRLYQFLQRRNLFFWVDTYQLTLHEKKYLFIVIQQIFHQTFTKCVSRAVLHHQYARLYFVLCLLRIRYLSTWTSENYIKQFNEATIFIDTILEIESFVHKTISSHDSIRNKFSFLSHLPNSLYIIIHQSFTSVSIYFYSPVVDLIFNIFYSPVISLILYIHVFLEKHVFEGRLNVS